MGDGTATRAVAATWWAVTTKWVVTATHAETTTWHEQHERWKQQDQWKLHQPWQQHEHPQRRKHNTLMISLNESILFKIGVFARGVDRISFLRLMRVVSFVVVTKIWEQNLSWFLRPPWSRRQLQHLLQYSDDTRTEPKWFVAHPIAKGHGRHVAKISCESLRHSTGQDPKYHESKVRGRQLV